MTQPRADVRVELVARRGLFGRDAALLQLVLLRERGGFGAALSLLVRCDSTAPFLRRFCSASKQ